MIIVILMNGFPQYQNRDIKATKTASEELWQLKKDLWDVLEILESGYDCSVSRRKKEITEGCLRAGNHVFKAVVADCGRYWLLIHFGKFTYKKR